MEKKRRNRQKERKKWQKEEKKKKTGMKKEEKDRRNENETIHTTSQKPRLPHLSPAATRTESSEGWIARLNTLSFTTLSTRDGETFIRLNSAMKLKTQDKTNNNF